MNTQQIENLHVRTLQCEVVKDRLVVWNRWKGREINKHPEEKEEEEEREEEREEEEEERGRHLRTKDPRKVLEGDKHPTYMARPVH